MFALKYYAKLKSTFGIRALLASRGCLCGKGSGLGENKLQAVQKWRSRSLMGKFLSYGSSR
jgi:hypothetical protein